MFIYIWTFHSHPETIERLYYFELTLVYEGMKEQWRAANSSRQKENDY
jgi:hypothetical protein